jgi:hypothetical protein
LNTDLISFIEIDKWEKLTPKEIKRIKRIKGFYHKEDDLLDGKWHIWLHLKDKSVIDAEWQDVKDINRVELMIEPTDTYSEAKDILMELGLI